jgi:hypothetical protein
VIQIRIPLKLEKLLRAHAAARMVPLSKIVRDILILWTHSATPRKTMEYFAENKGGRQIGSRGYESKIMPETRNGIVPPHLAEYEYVDAIGQPHDFRLPTFPLDSPPGYLQSLGWNKDEPLTDITRWLEWSGAKDNENKRMPT